MWRTADAGGVSRTNGMAAPRGVLLLRTRRAPREPLYSTGGSGRHAWAPPLSSTLWKRLSQHRGNSGGGFPGGGNHRGSIFRLHVGEALLASGDYPPEISRPGGGGLGATGGPYREYPLERDVSTYIRAMPFLWVDVDDPPTRPVNGADRTRRDRLAEQLRQTASRPSIANLVGTPFSARRDPQLRPVERQPRP